MKVANGVPPLRERCRRSLACRRQKIQAIRWNHSSNSSRNIQKQNIVLLGPQQYVDRRTVLPAQVALEGARDGVTCPLRPQGDRTFTPPTPQETRPTCHRKTLLQSRLSSQNIAAQNKRHFTSKSREAHCTAGRPNERGSRSQSWLGLA